MMCLALSEHNMNIGCFRYLEFKKGYCHLSSVAEVICLHTGERGGVGERGVFLTQIFVRFDSHHECEVSLHILGSLDIL